MTQETFDKCIRAAKDAGETIFIGGGEPTLHPLFKNFLMQAVWEFANETAESESRIGVVTNGSKTEIALTLAKLAKQGMIFASLSRDSYHDPIDEKVVEAFKVPVGYSDNRDAHDQRSIRGNDNGFYAAGRGKKNGGRKGCCCDSLFVNPKGILYPCGCRKTKLGVIGDVEIEGDWWQGDCEHSSTWQNMLHPDYHEVVG